MEPLDDRELDTLLRQWQAPGAPPGLAEKVLLRPASWWNWFATGTIRIPVPVGIALLLAVAALVYFRPTEPSPVAQPATATVVCGA